jgi:hypothetical protein
MHNITEEALLKNDSIKKAEFNGEWYFCIKDLQKLLGVEIKETKTIPLPIGENNEPVYCIRLKDLELPEQELSEFDKLLLKALKFNPKNK